ncbi:hypothetical protein H6G08_12420 [Calothrix anomala FACHB-343]|uniref:Transposase n=2 Tax=Calothrix TaxID=1186 RepID=A0ABR8A9S1_9CYAN|nr:hypothetical protein [Calothrix parietina FACHB-288]MBD2225304.1 hypothetical protein [Calothrix anomala FACHB-343]
MILQEMGEGNGAGGREQGAGSRGTRGTRRKRGQMKIVETRLIASLPNDKLAIAETLKDCRQDLI